ncbi:hypothetical protein BU24DRAFT_97640 [Aaosphaeria arxii CBS 175.79]|uniref:Secreted protein n=1 Tax=Aaosphaeria arxii CBS 175.79 TaxID=1450172 RepID=A0A6A5X6U7_9PLEO|nr:uncharacterized protein BU24DRAFT_97640 [Aaosphaeria arxii CBS 175.79]KAF2008504.1 hypothetical protein BU24DRAFT_97640 [Aaosphaeria arxii CBS 175.79]
MLDRDLSLLLYLSFHSLSVRCTVVASLDLFRIINVRVRETPEMRLPSQTWSCRSRRVLFPPVHLFRHERQ